MNTTTAPADQHPTQPRQEVDQPTPRRRRALRHALLVALSGVFVMLGMTATATPAEAATSVSYCFVNNYGQPLDRETTTVWVWYNGGWTQVGTDRTGTNGCSSVNTYWYAGYYIRVSPGTFTSRLRGELPLIARPGSGHVHLGTGVAHLSWI